LPSESGQSFFLHPGNSDEALTTALSPQDPEHVRRADKLCDELLSQEIIDTLLEAYVLSELFYWGSPGQVKSAFTEPVRHFGGSKKY
jgi:hypothetical protein